MRFPHIHWFAPVQYHWFKRVITGLHEHKKKEQVPTTLRRGRDWTICKSHQSHGKLNMRAITQGITGMVRTMLHHAERARWPTFNLLSILSTQKIFWGRACCKLQVRKKSILIRFLFNSFALLNFENKSDLFSRSCNLGRCIRILHSHKPLFL